MESKKINATYEERTSKEGKSYKCIVLRLASNYEKLVFLSVPELALLENDNSSEKQDISPYDFK